MELVVWARSLGTMGWEVFSLDIDPKAHPTLLKDILHVGRSGLPQHVDAVWASPLCTYFFKSTHESKDA